MADQSTGTVENTDAALAQGSGHMEHNPGRPMSWVGVAIVGCLSLLLTKTMNEDWY